MAENTNTTEQEVEVEDVAALPEASVPVGMPEDSTRSVDNGEQGTSEETPPGKPASEVSEESVPETSEDVDTIEVDGQQVPKNEVFDAYTNQKAWRKSNTEKAQALSAREDVLRQKESQSSPPAAASTQPLSNILHPQRTVTPVGPMPDPADQPEKFHEWIISRDQARDQNIMNQTMQNVQPMVERMTSDARAKDNGERMAKQIKTDTDSMQTKFFEDHSEVTPKEWEDVYGFVRDNIKLTRINPDTKLEEVNDSALETALIVIRARNGVYEKEKVRAKAEGVKSAVDELNVNQEAKVLSGKGAETPGQKRDAAFYMANPAEFEALTPDQRQLVVAAFAQLPATQQQPFLGG